MHSGTLLRPTAAAGAANVIDRSELGPLDRAGVSRLRDLVSVHGVAFVRGFGTDAGDLATVAAALGELQPHPLGELTGATSAISVIEDSAERPPAGFPWHTDLSWMAQPPRFGVLQALLVPPAGGDTMWVDLRRAYDRLPRTLRRRCCELDLVHDAGALAESVGRRHGAATERAFRSRFAPAVHPLVRAHPDDHSPVLWLCPMYATRIAGQSAARSAELLSVLHEQLDDPALITRWTWTTGDLAVWDETATDHRALTDHFPALRRMRRCVTAGGPVVAYRDVAPW